MGKPYIAYLNFDKNCQLCNQLYFVLNAFKTRNDRHLDFIQYVNSDLLKLLVQFGVDQSWISDRPNGSTSLAFAHGNPFFTFQGTGNLCQDFGKCYTIDDLRQFFDRTLRTSKSFDRICQKMTFNRDSTIAIHCRAGDYLSGDNAHSYGFDAEKYLNAIVDRIDTAKIDQIDVYSNDLDLVKNTYSGFFAKFKTVRYMVQEEGENQVDDLFKLAQYRHKILWNSTYSYWSAYISNWMFGDNYDSIYVPNFHCSFIYDGKPWQLNPKWRIINV